MATNTKAPRAPKPTKPAKSRTLDRVPPEEFKALVRDLGLTHREVAEAVGRSTSLVAGWLGTPGQMRPTKDGGEKPTNPPLARARLADVTRELKAFARQKGRGGKAPAAGKPYIADVTPNPRAADARAHAEAEKPARPHVPAALVEKRRREKAAREAKAAQA